jgi:hypothetical protein
MVIRGDNVKEIKALRKAVNKFLGASLMLISTQSLSFHLPVKLRKYTSFYFYLQG